MGWGEGKGMCLNMELKIINWNVWGLNDFSKCQVVKEAVRKWKPHLVCFQETKVEKVDKEFVDGVGGNTWTDWDFLGAMGSTGGVLVMWDRRVFLKVDSVAGFHSVSCLLKGVEDDFTWVFSGV